MIVTIVAWLVVVLLAIPFTVLAAELGAGLAGKSSGEQPPAPAAGTTIAVLMPAHNEADGIADIVMALQSELSNRVHLVVVADNCEDETAAIASAAGATVIERHDPSQRGKGHALAFGRDWLRSDPPDCVIVLDADCTVEPGTLDRLAAAALGWQRPVQGRYLLHSAGDSPMVQLSNFAFYIKNAVRQRGSSVLGAAAILGGTGMAFPWTLFAKAPLATSDLVEDLALGVHFTAQGNAPRFLPQAAIWSRSAAASDTLAQRTRWEHGFIATARRQAVPLVLQGLRPGRGKLVGMGLHLLVPPLALLMTLGLAGLGLTAGVAIFGGPWVPAVLLGGLISLASLLLLIAWWRGGREIMPGSTLLRVPAYLLWKLPVYLRLAGNKQTQWVRTKRSD